MSRILDSSFRYTPSHSTDISKRFEAIRREQARRERVCAECEPWFDASSLRDARAVAFLAGVANIRRGGGGY